MNVQFVKFAFPFILIHTQQFVGVIVTVLATDHAVQEEKFFVMNVLLDPVITRLASHCTPSEPLPNRDSDAGRKPCASFPLASSTGILFSSDAPLDVFTNASLLGTNNAPVSPVPVPDHLCAGVAISTFPATVVLAFGVVELPKSVHAPVKYC